MANRKRPKREAPLADAEAWDRLWTKYMAAIRAKKPGPIVAAASQIVDWDRKHGWSTMSSILRVLEDAKAELEAPKLRVGPGIFLRELPPHVGHERWEKGIDWIVIRPRDPETRWVWNNKREHWTENVSENNARRRTLQREGWTLMEHEH